MKTEKAKPKKKSKEKKDRRERERKLTEMNERVVERRFLCVDAGIEKDDR